ncbi:MAG: hypothetical protein U9R72_01680 [Chloroflexota bacterium]|nr:hypothetical protein [Chloroflexota bacterium]
MGEQTAREGARDEVARIIKTAHTLGIEVDEVDVTQWLTSMAASDAMKWEIDEEAGIYGHEITLLDFDKATLERYRRIADVVELPDRPNVETAISIAGSAAQGVIQRYPGDCDYFERVNIRAATQEEACQILADVIRQKALDTLEGPDYALIEVKFGTWKTDVIKDGERLSTGSPISWDADEIRDGTMPVFRASGEPWDVDWSYGCLDPGWCKMDWVIAEPAALRYQVSALLDTLDDAGRPGSPLDRKTVVEQTDRLIRDVIETVEGPMESELVMALLRLRDDVTGWMALGDDRGALITDSQRKLKHLINEFFQEKLVGIPQAQEFLEQLAGER